MGRTGVRGCRAPGLSLALLVGAAGLGCGGDFDTARSTPARASLGRELYGLLCDRIGAQALREDVTGISYHAVCHPDAAGAYAAHVDTSLLVALDPAALDVDGHPVPLAQQTRNRAYRVARIEALSRRREDLVEAFDAAIPDVAIAVKDVANVDPTRSCDAAPGTGKDALPKQLAATLGRITDLYDDRTIPLLTESFARVLDGVRASPETQAALTHLDARQGYRPSSVAIGVARPALSYPRLVDLANALLKVVATDSDPYNPSGRITPDAPLSSDNRRPIAGKASAELQALLAVLHEELRTTTATATPAPLGEPATDTTDPSRKILSRPRGSLELLRRILFASDDAFARGGPTPRLVVQRDPRGVAQLAAPAGSVSAPFVDLAGPSGAPDGLPDLDALGRFATTTGAPVASPFFSPGAPDGPRDALGLAISGTQHLYAYLDTNRTFLASLSRDVQPLFDPDPAANKEAVVNLLGGMQLLFGSHDVNAASSRTYPPDPTLADAWKLAHKGPPPADVGKTPVLLAYKGYHPEDAPLVDLVYAVGQVLSDPTTEDTLQLFRQLVVDHPNELARLVGVALQIKAIADRHPEAHIPAQSTLWDELLDVIAKMAHVEDAIGAGGILEDLISAFARDETLNVKDAFTAYIDFKDEITYDTKDLNGTAFNLTTGDVSPMRTPVDRSRADTGENRSALQRFMQLLHDANGLGACTKDGAVAHVQWNGIKLDYPTDALARTACGLLGQPTPSHMNQCGILRFDNVAALLLDVALGRAKFDIRDPCLKTLVNSPLTGFVGGVDAFLEDQSGVKGFSTHPTVNGISRMVFYDTPHDADPGDPSNPKTERFFKDLLDPVPSMVCPLSTFVDPSDGKTLNLRKCSSFADTLRGRDDNALFPLEQLDFIKNVQPLAAAFADHGQPLLFVDLFDTLHRHWGSPAQSKAECDPSLPRTDSRWCSQDGAVSYEGILSEALKTDLFQALHDVVPVLQKMTVQHCVAQDAQTHVCTKQVPYTGVKVLAESVRALVDPARSAQAGLRDRRGAIAATRNDGGTNPQTTPMYLLLDSLKGVDRAFDDFAAASHGSTERRDRWRTARSQLVDTFFAVQGGGASTELANKSTVAILPTVLDTVREQVAAHCPDARITGDCAWARQELTQNLSNVVSGPTFAALMDVVEAVRSDDAARTELERLVQYLLGSPDAQAQEATVIAAHDILQALEDETNLTPLIRSLAEATSATLLDDDGKVVRRSLADALIEVLSRLLARAYDEKGDEVCATEVDPNRAMATVMGKLVTPMGDERPAPIEVLIDVVADVNRAHPDVDTRTPLDPSDYANISSEVSDFCMNPSRGLEQVYEVIREATKANTN